MKDFKLTGGHWKLWHDVRLRALASLLIVVAVLYGSFGPDPASQRPKACVSPADGELWRMALGQTEVPLVMRLPSVQRDAEVLARHCGSLERPLPYYATMVEQWRAHVTSELWLRAVPFVLLFIGILLSAGPPFSGESMEAFTLTFSLPWSRQRWLRRKAVLSFGLICALVILVCIVNLVGVYFPYLGQLAEPGVGHLSHMPTPTAIARALLAGSVGIALGTWMSILTRNALAATLGAGIVAYALIGVDLSEVIPNAVFNHVIILSLDSATSVFVALMIITGAALLSTIRLRLTDF